ncbi:MAG TPA: LytTR family DNA-binding domain-containing protein [Vicinamibacterales bacterium]|nr:LytTR family DNA-binding domain-containing protein [Vicinamibacterales bacterium]
MDSLIRTIIADDEPLARESIRLHVERHAGIEIVAEARDGQEAAGLVTEARPDLLFLDVQMPVLDGFEVLEAIAGVHLPVVILVTAHDQHALRAFDVHALDYLLKPFTAARFDEALQRARDEIASRGAHATRRRLLDLLAARGLESAYLARFVVRHGERFVLVRVSDVSVFEANGNYIRLRTPAGNYMIRMTMAELEQKLDPARFARIHRSTMVNVDGIREITPAWHGDFEVHLSDGQRLRLSRNFRDRLLP